MRPGGIAGKKKEKDKLSSNIIKDNSRTIKSKKTIEKDKSSKIEIMPSNNIIEPKQNSEVNELKIELFPDKVPNRRSRLEKRSLLRKCLTNYLGDSLDNIKTLAFPYGNVPLLDGFYVSHCKHYPIRIKPDDIWLLIVQAFSNHVNANAERLRKYFVNFEGKQNLEVIYKKGSIKEIDKKTLEDFTIQINEQMKKYLGEEIIQILTSDFTTTNYDSLIISKLSIMAAFQKYFDYTMGIMICGIPYIILEGTVDDYQKIKAKAEKLSKYEFDWYINKIIPHIQKMIEAKMGKADINYFRNIIKRNEVKDSIEFGCSPPEDAMISNINGWILDFFAYEKTKDDKLIRFDDKSLKVKDFNRLASQMLAVPFTIKDYNIGKEYKMYYHVGFIGCDQNEKKEVFPVQAWVVASSTLKSIGGEELKDPFPPKRLSD